MKCPACQAAVHHRQIQDGLARCQWCNHVWDTATDPRGAAAAPPPNVPTVPLEPVRSVWSPERPPAGAQVLQHDDEVTLRLPWRRGPGVVGHGMYLTLTGMVMAGWVVEGPSPLLLLLSPVALLYLYVLVNRTLVEITVDGVVVSHGPLPSPLDRTVVLPVRKLGHLRVEETFMATGDRHSLRSRTVSNYSLMAGDERLMRKFASEEVVRYVAEAIADTVDGSVRITRC